MPQFSLYKYIFLSILLFASVLCIQAQTNSYSLHKIKKGETLSTIAKTNKTTVSALMELNNLTAKSKLKLGKSIKIPNKQEIVTTPVAATPTTNEQNRTEANNLGFKEHIIKPKESFYRIAKDNETTVAAIMKLNGLNTKSVLKPGETIKIPVKEALLPPPVETMSTLIPSSTNPDQTIEVSVIRKQAPEVSAPQQIAYTKHTIQPKETLVSIAKANHTTVSAILRLNSMKTKRPLKRGETIKIPGVVEPVAVSKPSAIAAPTPAPGDATTTDYVIKPNETLSAIAKNHHTTVGNIMRMNGMNAKSVLKNGAIIKVPASETNIPSSPIAVMPNAKPVAHTEPSKNTPVVSTTTTTRPIKYIVSKRDNLYKISKQFKTTEAQLKEWNGMNDDKVRPGMGLIVGQETVTAPTLPIEEDNHTSLIHSIEKKTNSLPIDASSSNTKIAKDATRVVKDTLTTQFHKPVVDSTNKSVQETIANSESLDIVEPILIPKYAKYAEKEGFFASYFDRKHLSDNTTTGDAAAFKTTSGWDDKKYYILINDINQGSIVRITMNDKSICAKVMGPLPTIKEDNGLIARISSAAADALGVQDAVKFTVTINY